MPIEITSPANARVKNVARLRRRTKPSGLVLVDGQSEAKKAFESGCAVSEIFICPEIASGEIKALVKNRKEPVYETGPEIFRKLTDGEDRGGILLVCEPKMRALDDITVGDKALFLILENVEKPGNLGAILRTCESAGVDAVLVCDQQTYIFNPNVVRASMGSVFTVKIICDSAQNIEAFLKRNGVRIYIAAPNVEKAYTDIDFKQKSGILVGAENSGVSDFWMSKTHEKINIPMLGTVDSLNVSCSSAIILYEAVRQRQ